MFLKFEKVSKFPRGTVIENAAGDLFVCGLGGHILNSRAEAVNETGFIRHDLVAIISKNGFEFINIGGRTGSHCVGQVVEGRGLMAVITKIENEIATLLFEDGTAISMPMLGWDFVPRDGYTAVLA